MPLEFQFRRISNYDNFSGLEGEVTYSTSLDTIVVHDGSSANPVLNERLRTDVRLSHSDGSHRILDRNDRVLLDDRGRYPLVLPLSTDEEGNENANQVLRTYLPPTDRGHDQYALVLGRNEVGDGYGGLYQADRLDTIPLADDSYYKIPIQDNPDNGHWKYIPTAGGPSQISLKARIRSVDISTVSEGPLVLFRPTILDWFVPHHLDFFVRDEADGNQPTDTVYRFGWYDGSTYNRTEDFTLVPGTYTSNSVLSHYFFAGSAFETNNNHLYIEVLQPSSGGSSVVGDIMLFGYSISD